MFTARLTLPADISDEDIAFVAHAAGGYASAHSALRAKNHGENHGASLWHIEWILEDPPETADLNARLFIAAQIAHIELPDALTWDIAPVPEIDWLAHSYQQFPPFSVGPFFIYGAHYDGDIPAEQISLQIDAATAFGSGEHGTTKGCLRAMLDLKGQGACPWNVLDMGTGSGILAIAAWKLWKTPVLAVDNDPESINVTRRHLAANGVKEGSANVTCAVGEGFAADIAQDKKPFDLIIANILAGPLKDMAHDLAAVADENGYVILSGILTEQADSVITAYKDAGLTLARRTEIGEWSTLLLQA